MKVETARSPERIREYEKSKQLAWDIVNSRLKKIVALSSGPVQTGQIQRRITSEERVIYNQLCMTITDWKEQILNFEGER
jgi:DNA replication initiation complex subunit (GINS family)